MNSDQLFQQFDAFYGLTEIPKRRFFAPGSFNLIGDHTDYNGGLVLSCNIQLGTNLVIRKNEENILRFRSLSKPELVEIFLTEPVVAHPVRWVNYPLGVIAQFQKMDVLVPGMDLFFAGDIPFHAGLNASGSMSMVTAFAINQILEVSMDMKDLVRLVSRAEHELAGTTCSIMDAFVIAEGISNSAIFLNTYTLEYSIVPLLFSGYRLILADTGQLHTKEGSKYFERLAECQLAVAFLAEKFGLSRLAVIGFPQFFKSQEQIPDEVIRRRARHVISENQRVINAVSCLLKGEIGKFGALMNASHESLRDNFEVTGTSLDALVDEAWNLDGVIGSRMTGSGLGGCTISLVKEEAVEQFIQQVGEGYNRKTGLDAEFYLITTNDGVKELHL